MRHNVSGRKFSRSPAHRKMLYRNLVTSLFRYERITTTVQKAKEARVVAEKLITKAKMAHVLMEDRSKLEQFKDMTDADAKGRGLTWRREAAKKLTDPSVLQKLFSDIGPRYVDRPGGYTRILRLNGGRKGDNAEMAILELVDSTVKPKVIDGKKRTRQRRILAIEEKAEAKAALEEAAADAAADVAEAAEAAETDETPEEVVEASTDDVVDEAIVEAPDAPADEAEAAPADEPPADEPEKKDD